MSAGRPLAELALELSWFVGRDAAEGYVWLREPYLVLSGGPDRVVRDEPDPEHRPRPVGFAPGGRHRAHGPASTTPPIWTGVAAPGRHRREGL